MVQTDDLAGIWNCKYYYPSNEVLGTEEISQYEVQAERTGNNLICQSLPTESGSYILIKLLVEEPFASGSWTENTAPQGQFKGMIYSGVLQLLIQPDRLSMTGKWVGIGRDIQNQRPDVYDGRWIFSRNSQ